MKRTFLWLCLVPILILSSACESQKKKPDFNDSTEKNLVENSAPTVRTVAFRIEGFKKSKSGAIWMAWPDAVKQVLVGLDAIQKVQMRLDRDEFIISYDPAEIDEPGIIADINKAGYKSYVVKNNVVEEESRPQSKTGVDPVFDEALARAKKEQKLIVIDFTASWCVPCKKMLKVTFPDPRVASLLKQCIFLKIDTDKHPALAERFGVIGLPDIRFLSSDGQEIKRLLNYQSPEVFARHLSEILTQKH